MLLKFLNHTLFDLNDYSMIFLYFDFCQIKHEKVCINNAKQRTVYTNVPMIVYVTLYKSLEYSNNKRM